MWHSPATGSSKVVAPVHPPQHVASSPRVRATRLPRPARALVALLAGLLTYPVAVAAQPAPPRTDAATPDLRAAAPPDAPRLTPEQMDRLLEPFAGAPQDIPGIVLDACRYPSELLEAAQWSRQPEASRGPAKDSWPPTVRLLAERAPRTVDYLTQDIARTAALGSAYQTQPNDVWMAYGRVTAARMAEAAAAPQAPAPAEPANPAAGPAAPPPSDAGGAPQALRDEAKAPTAPPPATAAAPTVVAPEAVPATQPPVVVVNPAPTQVVTTDTGTSSATSALVGGVVGFGAGLLVSELFDDDWNGPSYGWGAPAYRVPPPYAPYGGARHDAARSAARGPAGRSPGAAGRPAVCRNDTAGRTASGRDGTAG